MAIAQTYIHSKGKTYGPYNNDELIEHVRSGRVPFSSWVYQNDEWVLFAENLELRAKHPDYENAPDAAPTKKAAERELKALLSVVKQGQGTVSSDMVWFVIREKSKFGPYSAADIVGQLQRKELGSTNFVWRPGFETWQKISTVGEFSKDSMKSLVSSSESIDILVKRKFARAPYEVEVVAHDNRAAIEGRTMVIGEGGLFLNTVRPTHRVGARLKLHFRVSDLQPFNAVAEIVSVVRGEMPGYCLKFVALSDGDRRRIAKFVSERSSR